MAKDFRLKIKIYNNHLIRCREALKLSTAQAAAKIGIHYVEYMKYEAMTQSPLSRRDGTIIPNAERIMFFYKKTFEQLWPASVLKIKKNKVIKEVDAEMALTLAGNYTRQLERSPEELVALKEEYDAVIDQMSEREEEVIKRRFGLDGYHRHNHDELGGALGVSAARVWQIEKDALHRIREGYEETYPEMFTVAPEEIVLHNDPIREAMRQVLKRRRAKRKSKREMSDA